MIVYTRWDYVDRDTNVAHHPWLCYPDGRDPRSFHGNYPVNRKSRPWMEMSMRAIPGSHKYVATAAAHHGHAFGSLVLLDQSLEDDNAMSQLTRLTPETPFPEAEGGRKCQQYATSWPLSEDDYLCVYDPNAKNHALYWIDRFGNKEKIYEDGSISCLSPIPLRPRPRPPVLFESTTQTVRGKKALGGERMTCQGCHEPKQRAPIMGGQVRMALERAPSTIQPDVAGSNPFNYPRLVQPVLDRNCVDCHQKEKALDLTGGVEKNGFTRSYNSLAKEYGFYFHVSNGSIRDKLHGGSRSIAGQFGAKAAPLMNYLDKSHHGVELSREDLHRIVLWLDCNSEFLGSYENAPAQARGEEVHPSLR